MQSVSVGPFLFSVAVVALLLGYLAARVTAGFMARRGCADVGDALWWLLLAVLVGARLGYVVRMWGSYQSHWPTIFDIRDGGFDVTSGLMVLALGMLVLLWRRRHWRVSLPVSVLMGVAVWGFVTVAMALLRQGAHAPMPTLVLDDLRGQPVKLTSFQGRPTVLNLWATWCGPCRREMPVLVQAQKDHPGVYFVLANQGESAARVGNFLDSQGLSPDHVLLDPGSELSRHYRTPGYPVTLFLDARGRLIDRHIGALSHATLDERLQGLAAARFPTGEDP